jgi:DNA-directed RNA polymerase subunit omega
MTEDSRVQYSAETAVAMVGNRFDLVLIAAARVRELKKGHLPKVKVNGGPTSTALREIEEGFIGRDHLKRIDITQLSR